LGLASRDGRAAAAAILDKVESGRGHTNALLAALPRGMDERDRGLATELVYGALRRRRSLDALIERWSSRPLEAIDPAVLTHLRLAVYQILFLTRVPRAAAVDEAVKSVRARRGPAAGAFTNAVLRATCRALDERPPAALERPDSDHDQPALVAYLERVHSFPPFLVERFLGRYGAAGCEALLTVMNRPAPLTLRSTLRGGGPESVARRLASEGVTTAPSAVCAGSLRVVRGVPQHTKTFREGAFYIQDEASQLVARLLLPLEEGKSVLDLCAAPGGKILAAAEARPSAAGLLVAADRSLARLKALEENARASAVHGILRIAMDATRPALRTRFHRILLDAPCSGTGIIRRHPEIRWRRTPADIERFARLQATALIEASLLLAPGGRLVYAVCSLEPEEGPERVAALMESRRDLRPIDARALLPSVAAGMVDGDGCLRTLPHRDDMDGFFAAVLERAP